MGCTNGNGNEFSFSTIKNILINPKYMGYYCGNKTHKYDYRSNDRKTLDRTEWVMYKDEETVPPIVSAEIWEKANYILSARSKKQSTEDKTSYQNKYPYSGKIYCMEHNVPYYRALYRYKSGDKEVWQCKEYSAKGKAGCTSPTIYTAELDMVMKEAYHAIVIEKSNIIHDLIKIYSSIGSESQVKEDIAKCRTQINQILSKKDKLLDLSIDGRLSNNEFEARNNAFNEEIDKLRLQIEDLEEQEQKNKEVTYSVETLRKMIANELDFENGFDNAAADALIDRIEVYKTEDKKVIDLKIYFKVLEEVQKYTVKRGKNNTSVCFAQYI
jgi:hypothetical protein